MPKSVISSLTRQGDFFLQWKKNYPKLTNSIYEIC
jgi:hypothetical protein